MIGNFECDKQQLQDDKACGCRINEGPLPCAGPEVTRSVNQPSLADLTNAVMYGSDLGGDRALRSQLEK